MRPNAQFGAAVRAAANEAFLLQPSDGANDDTTAAAPTNGFKQLSEREEMTAQRALESLQALKDGKPNGQVSRVQVADSRQSPMWLREWRSELDGREDV